MNHSYCLPHEFVTGLASSLQVSWWKTRSRLDGKNHHPEKHSLTFNADRNDGMIPGLEPFSEYRLTVLAFNSKGAGPESLTYDFQTPEGGKDGQMMQIEGGKVANSISVFLHCSCACHVLATPPTHDWELSIKAIKYTSSKWFHMLLCPDVYRHFFLHSWTDEYRWIITSFTYVITAIVH